MKREMPLFSPDLFTAIKENNISLSALLNCHKVGKITSFNTIDKTCTVQILEKYENINGIFDYPPLTEVPLLINGSKDGAITFGDVVGEQVVLHFNDSDIDNWFETGETYIPNTLRTHSISDGFAQLSPKLPQISYEIDGIVLQKGSSKIKMKSDGTIEITGNVVHIGNWNTTGNITATGIITGETDVIGGAISVKGHVHGGVQSGTSNTSPPK